MKTASFWLPVSIDETLPDTSDPLFQTAQLALIVTKTIEALDTAGFEFAAIESSDAQSQLDILNTAVQSAYTEINALYGGGEV